MPMKKDLEGSNAHDKYPHALQGKSFYWNLLEDNDLAQKALLVCIAALTLDDETAVELIHFVSQNKFEVNELLYKIKNLGCTRERSDGSWFVTEEVRQGLMNDLYNVIPYETVSNIRHHLASKAINRLKSYSPHSEVTEYRHRLDAVEAGYQEAFLADVSSEGFQFLIKLWEISSPSAASAIAKTVSHLIPEIESHVKQLPIAMVFLQGIAVGEGSHADSYFLNALHRSYDDPAFNQIAYYIGILKHDSNPELAENAYKASVASAPTDEIRAAVYYYLGNLYGEQKRLDEAKEAHGRCHELSKFADVKAINRMLFQMTRVQQRIGIPILSIESHDSVNNKSSKPESAAKIGKGVAHQRASHLPKKLSM